MKRPLSVAGAIAVLLVAGLLPGLLVGCSPKAEVSGPAVPGQGTLRLYGQDPFTLDPALSGDATSHQFVVQIFSGLVKLGDDLEPEPDIARSWKVSRDGMTYTFTLRQDVKFHDGRPLMAADFVYSWERACDPRTGSMTAPTYLGDIVGVRDVLAGRAHRISGVRAIDDYTLEVKIDAPRPYFLYKLAYPTAFVVDRANVASGGEWWRAPNGTGPFRLASWQPGSSLVLERNPGYYGRVAGVARVEFKLFGGVPMNLYEDGEIDVTGVSLSYIDRATDEQGPFYTQLAIVPELSLTYIGFNAARPPFDDPYVRRAFSHAVDREKLARLVFRGMVEPAYGILPAGMPGYNEDLQGLEFSLDRAREAISRSRYGSFEALPPITLTTSGWGNDVSRDLEAIIYDWRQALGVDVKVRVLEPPRFFYNLKEEKDEMFAIGWVADYPHPQNFLDILFRSGSENNYGEYSNPAVDALLEEAGTEVDGARSLELYRQVEQMLVDDAAILPLWFGENFLLVKPYVRGYRLNPMGFARLNEVTLAE